MNIVMASFVFLRPSWLFLLIPALLLGWLLWRKTSASHGWSRWISPNLLSALLVNGAKKGKIQPLHLLLALWFFAIVGLSGPSWRFEASPFAQDEAVLSIALEVTPSMGTRDIQPSRRERAVQKITDLLALRKGARQSLVAYAGSAHLVMPPTQDSSVILEMLPDLAPDILPKEGDDAAAALKLATDQIKRTGDAGAILFVADGFRDSDLDAFAAQKSAGLPPVHVLAIGNDPSLQEAASNAGGSCIELTADNNDVISIASKIQETARRASQDEAEKREDGGYYFIIPAALISLLGFRRGWILTT